MATIQEQINQLKVDKQTLVDNLVAKGVEATNNETFTTLVPKVKDIQGGIDINDYFNTNYSGTSPKNWVRDNLLKKAPDIIIDDSVTSLERFCQGCSFAPKIICNSNVTNMNSMYYQSTSKNIDVSGLNTSMVTSMTYMFGICSNLESLDLSNFNTSNVTDMSYMFYNPNKIKNLDLSNFNTSKVTKMNNMFSDAPNYISINVSSFDTSQVQNMERMFGGCSGLTSLDLSNFITSKVTDVSQLFLSCRKLTRLDIRNFDFTNVTSYSNMFYNVPTNCLIIVKDDTAKTWITEKFTTLTNVKTVAELGE